MTLPPNPFNGRISQDELADYAGDLLAPVIDMNQPQGRRNKKIPLSAIVAAAAVSQADLNHCLLVGFDGGGSAISADSKRRLFFPFAVRITQCVLLADDDVTAEVDIWVKAFATTAAGQPTVSDSICGATLPTLTAAAGSSDAELSDWTTDVPAGSTMIVNVNDAGTATELTLALWIVEPAPAE